MLEVDAVVDGTLLQLRDFRGGELPAETFGVVVAGRERNAVLDGDPEGVEPAAGRGNTVVAVVLGEGGADADHAATDVHANRGRDARTDRRDDGSDRAPLAEVSIGHQRDIRMDERHRGRLPGLLERAALDLRCPVEQLLARLDGRHACSSPTSGEHLARAPGMAPPRSIVISTTARPQIPD